MKVEIVHLIQVTQFLMYSRQSIKVSCCHHFYEAMDTLNEIMLVALTNQPQDFGAITEHIMTSAGVFGWWAGGWRRRWKRPLSMQSNKATTIFSTWPPSLPRS